MVSRCFATPSICGPLLVHRVTCDEFEQPLRCQEKTLLGCQGKKERQGGVTKRGTSSIYRLIRAETGSNPRESSQGLSGDSLRAQFPGCIQRSIASGIFISPLPPVSNDFNRLLHKLKTYGRSAAQPGAVSHTVPQDNGGQLGTDEQETSATTGSFRLYSGACAIPHPDKVQKGGEDAHFISSEVSAVGVADGVGGWADVGVDPGEYARELMSQSVTAVKQEPCGLEDPLRVLAKAHSRTKCQGSSTACILILVEDQLQAVNLGDSGFLVVRNGATLFKSPPQQHDFNFPHQLGSSGCDPPQSADVFSLKVAVGDIIVVATDGVFDNVYETDIKSVVVHASKAGLSPQVTAERIAALASLRANDNTRMSPWARQAIEAGFRFHGGKPDDITVVVSYITAKQGNATIIPAATVGKGPTEAKS